MILKRMVNWSAKHNKIMRSSRGLALRVFASHPALRNMGQFLAVTPIIFQGRGYPAIMAQIKWVTWGLQPG